MQIELLVLDNNTWKHLIVCKQMILKNVSYKLIAYKSYTRVGINNPQRLICYKTQPTQTIMI